MRTALLLLTGLATMLVSTAAVAQSRDGEDRRLRRAGERTSESGATRLRRPGERGAITRSVDADEKTGTQERIRSSTQRALGRRIDSGALDPYGRDVLTSGRRLNNRVGDRIETRLSARVESGGESSQKTGAEATATEPR